MIIAASLTWIRRVVLHPAIDSTAAVRFPGESLSLVTLAAGKETVLQR